MIGLLRKCKKCGKYTLNQGECPYCRGQVLIPHPAKYSPDDKYAKYRSALMVEKDEKHERNIRE